MNTVIILPHHVVLRMLNVKMNLKGLYDSFECEVCKDEDETQKHIYECKQIWKIKGNYNDNIFI